MFMWILLMRIKILPLQLFLGICLVKLKKRSVLNGDDLIRRF